jgi:hypothetical protein
MKTFAFAALLLAYSSFALAETSKKFEQVSDIAALVTIKTEEQDGTQAAVYVDASDNTQFIQEMLKLQGSPLAELKKKIELENCEQTSTPENDWIDGCGQVVITEEVRTSFGRGGWMSAGAGYTFFVGFLSDGSGRFFDATHMVTIFENCEAQMKDGTFEYNGIVLKSLSLEGIKELEQSPLSK